MAPRNSITELSPSSEMILRTTGPEEKPMTSPQGKRKAPLNIVWRNVAVMSLLHIGAVYAIIVIPKCHPLTWIWTIFYYIFCAVGITAGVHRLWSHRSYKAKTPLRILLALMQAAAMQNDIIEWVRDHRVHHKYSETDADPHNVNRGFFFAHIGWLLVKKHKDVKEKGKNIDMSDVYADKVAAIQRRYYRSLAIFMCFILPTLVPWYFWNESLWNSYFVAGVFRYCASLNATWCVNSVAHIWGNKPYDRHINPVENVGVSLGAVGEGFHNFHHTFPTDYSASEFGWRLNITTMFIDFMAMLGQVTDRKTTSREVIKKRAERTGDGSRELSVQ